MPNDRNADSPKDATSGAEGDRAADGKALPKSGEGATPAGERDAGFGGETQGADHDTEEAAAYRENDA